MAVGTDAWLRSCRGVARSEALTTPGVKANPSTVYFFWERDAGAGEAPLGTHLLDGPGACVAFPFLLQPGGEGSPRFSLSSVSPLSPSQPLEAPCSVCSPLNPPISGSELSLVPGAGHRAGLCATASAGAGERRRGLDRARAGSLAPGCVSTKCPLSPRPAQHWCLAGGLWLCVCPGGRGPSVCPPPPGPALARFAGVRYACLRTQREGGSWGRRELISLGSAQEKTLLKLVIPGDGNQLKAA